MRRHVTRCLIVCVALLGLSAAAQDKARAVPIFEQTTAESPGTQPRAATPAPNAATPATPAAPSPAAPAALPSAAPAAQTPAAAPSTSTEGESASAADAAPAGQHIALLLPLKSKRYARAAEAVRDGLFAAAEQQPAEQRIALREYAVDDSQESITSEYIKAVLDGATLVIGPLAREGVTTLLKSSPIDLPTLALSPPDNAGLQAPANLYVLSLSLESEARQVATFAQRAGKCSAVIISADTALARRMAGAFNDQWRKLNCVTLGEYRLQKESQSLTALRNELAPLGPDCVFVAGDTALLKRLRPYLKPGMAVYGTSQVFRGKADAGAKRELRGVQFVDMPWLLQPDHPAVAVYPQPKKPWGIDLQRFYALGLDAYRVAQVMLRSNDLTREFVDGVTGRISLGAQSTFVREAILATYQEDGSALALPPQ